MQFKTGLFVLGALLTTILASAQSSFFPAEVVVSASSLKIREKPDVSTGKVVATVPRGTVLSVQETFNDGEVFEVDTLFGPWYKVQSDKGYNGYVFAPFVCSTTQIFYEEDVVANPVLPPLQWYGVYQRDSFSDEVRRIEVRLKKQLSEVDGEAVNVLKTNQKQPSKFIIGSLKGLPTGYAGPLGITDSPGWFFEGGLQPGAMQPISAGQAPGDTTVGETYFLAATGCAALKNSFVQISGYQLQALELRADDDALIQNLTPWVNPELGVNPSVALLWYGDLDQDHRPDALIQDCPFEAGCRNSLFLSSKARQGELLHKVCEYFFYEE